MKRLDHRCCVAPMMEYSDRHDRFLLRLFSRNVVLYTEMVPVQALLNANHDLFLRHDSSEHPVALQLGGSDPKAMAQGAKIGEEAGFDEININVGCPSDRVQAGRFGACLMMEPELVARCFEEMQARVDIPVTVKCRIGVDKQDTFEHLRYFVEQLVSVGCQTFIIHARKAWLKGLSPKQNRDIPPLRYEAVYQLKNEFQDIEIVINGGIISLDEVRYHLLLTDGVMVGREAYRNPSMLMEVDRLVFGVERRDVSVWEALESYKMYIVIELNKGTPLHVMTKHILGMFHGMPGARAWRRHLSCYGLMKDAGVEIIDEAQQYVHDLQSQNR
jgi:tRNA-dihydrouridine synthase A